MNAWSGGATQPDGPADNLDVPRAEGVKLRLAGRGGPGLLLVVVGAVAQAAVLETDEAIDEGTQGLMVGGALGTELVLVGASAW